MKRLLIALIAAVPALCQTFQISNPAPGASWTDFEGNSFTVANVPAGTEMVCFTADAYAAANAPGPLVVSGNSGALLANGCSNSAPFSFPVNSFDWADGTAHLVYATAYSYLGATLGMTAAVTYSIANTWPVSCGGSAPQFTMSVPSTSSGPQVNVTLTMSGPCVGDSIQYMLYLNDQQVFNYTTTTATTVVPVDVNLVNSGTAVFAATAYDFTSGTNYAGGGYLVPYVGAAGEASQTVTLTESPTMMDVRLHTSAQGGGGQTLYLAPGGSVVLTPNVTNTDESDGTSAYLGAGNTFYYWSSDTTKATVGGCSGSVCSGSTTTVTAVAPQSAAKIYVMGGVTVADIMPAFSSTFYFVSATLGAHPDWAGGAGVEQMFVILNSTNHCIPGTYFIGSASLPASGSYYIVNDLNGNHPAIFTGTTGVGPCTGVFGATAKAYVQTNTTGNATPQIAHFSNQGAILGSYDPVHSLVVNSIFQGAIEDSYTQKYPVPIQNQLCRLGYNTLETGFPTLGSTSWGNYTPSALLTEFENELQNELTFVAGGGCNPYLWLTGLNMIRGLDNLNAATQGASSGRNGSAFSPSGIVQAFTAINYVNSLGGIQSIGMEGQDENGFNATPLGGPNTLGGTSGPQNFMGLSSQIDCLTNPGTCTVTTNNLGPGGTYQLWQYQDGFVITGSIQGFNTTIGGTCPVPTPIDATHFSFPTPAGVAAAIYTGDGHSGSVADPGLRIWMQTACQWYTPPSGGVRYTLDDALGYLRQQLNTVSPGFPYSLSTAAAEGPLLAACFAGTAACLGQSQVENGHTITQISNDTNLYWTHSCETYFLASKTNTLAYLRDSCDELVPHLRMYYGSYDPDAPLQTISQGASAVFAYEPAQGVPVSTCVGNTITFTKDPHLDAMLLGMARNWVVGNSDPNCNIHQVILSHPTATSITVARAGTSQVHMDQGTCTVTGASWTAGTVTLTTTCISGPDGAVSVGNSFTLSGVSPGAYNGTYRVTAAAGSPATSISFALVSNPGTWVSGGSVVTGGHLNGGTITFDDGNSFSLLEVRADGQERPTGYGETVLDYGASVCAGTGNTAFLKERGHNFVLSGVAGAGASYFNGLAGNYDAANLAQPTDDNGTTWSCANWWHEIAPAFNGTGGTGYPLGDNGLIPGRNPWSAMVLGNTSPAGTFLSVAGAEALRVVSHRLYQLMPNPNGYNNVAYPPQYKGGFPQYGLQAYGFTFATGIVNTQLYSHPSVENYHSVPDLHAGSVGSLMWTRTGCFELGGVALNAIDYGGFVLSGTYYQAAGNCRYLHMLGNFGGAAVTRLVNLTPYETAGQNVVLWIADKNGIKPVVIISAGTSTYLLTLQPGQMAYFAFPVLFPGFLQEPTVPLNVPSGTAAVGVQCGYDQYLLPMAPIVNLGAPTGGKITAALPFDRQIGPIYCLFNDVDSSGNLLAGGPNSAVQTF